MKCEDARLLLTEFLYDEIAPEEAGDLRLHLETCEACRREYEALQQTSLALQAWPQEEPPQQLVFVPPKPGWRQALKQVLYPEHVSWWGRLAFGLGAAALTLLVASAVFNLEIQYQPGSFVYRASLAPRSQTGFGPEVQEQVVAQLRRENQELVTRLVQAGYEQQRQELDRKLVSLANMLHQQRQNDLLLVGRELEGVQQSTATRFRQTDRMLNQLIRVVSPPRE